MGPEDKISDIHSSRKQEREEEGEIQNFGSMTACGSEAVRGEVWPTGPPRPTKNINSRQHCVSRGFGDTLNFSEKRKSAWIPHGHRKKKRF